MLLKTARKRWPLFSAFTIALIASFSAWNPGDLLGYFRQASALELFTLILFLMFIVGLEIDMRVFNATKQRSMGFGLATFLFPLISGIIAARLFDFGWECRLFDRLPHTARLPHRHQARLGQAGIHGGRRGRDDLHRHRLLVGAGGLHLHS